MTYHSPAIWRSRQPRYRLAGSRCLNCGKYSFPGRPICPRCEANSLPATQDTLELRMPSQVQLSIGLFEPKQFAIVLSNKIQEIST